MINQLLIAMLGFGITTAPTSQPTSQPATIQEIIAVPNHSDLHFPMPADWKESADPTAPGAPQTVQFIDASGKFQMLISIIPPQPGQDLRSFNSQGKLRAIAQAQGTQLLKSAKETSLALEEIRGPSSSGFCFTLTDKSPAPGSYEYLTGGVFGAGDLILSVTMLMHEQSPPQRAVALDMLRQATQQFAAPSTRPTDALRTISISLPDKSWQISLDAPAMNIVRDEMSPDRQARQLSAVDPDRAINVSIFIEPSAAMGDAKLARSIYFDRLKTSPILMRDDKFSDGPNGSARADYIVPDLDQHHVNLYFSKEGEWIDVHLSIESSKTNPTTQPSPSLEAIINSVRIEPKPPTTAPSR